MATLVAGQIVFLECRQARLYAEVIQVLDERAMGWVRPLALAQGEIIQPLGMGAIADPAAAPDMVWPIKDLTPALDTDVIPLMAQIWSKAAEPTQLKPQDDRAAGSAVGEFLRVLWAEGQQA
jgi:hypothetical protein